MILDWNGPELKLMPAADLKELEAPEILPDHARCQHFSLCTMQREELFPPLTLLP